MGMGALKACHAMEAKAGTVVNDLAQVIQQQIVKPTARQAPGFKP
jgi:hypothetical protein